MDALNEGRIAMGVSALPTWFWIVYYGFLLVSLLLSIYFLSRDVKSRISKIGNATNIWFILSAPLFSALNSIGRSGNEWGITYNYLFRTEKLGQY